MTGFRWPSAALLALALEAGCGVGVDLVDDEVFVRVNPSEVALEVGASAELTGEHYIRVNGEARVFESARLDWVSVDTGVAQVEPDGRIVAVSPGQTRIVASLREGTAEAREPDALEVLVTVVQDADEPARVRILGPDGSTPPIRLAVDTRVVLSATVQNLAGETIDEDVEWRTSSPAVAEVGIDGELVARAVGDTTIVARAGGVESRALHLSVFDPDGNGRVGAFVGTSNYTVVGEARLILEPGGALSLELGTDFASSNGPDLDVVLSNSQSVTGGSLNLGDLRSTSGRQSYAIPAGVGLEDYDFVVIQCVAFNVAFGYARLENP